MYRGDAMITPWAIKLYALSNNDSNTDILAVIIMQSRKKVATMLGSYK